MCVRTSQKSDFPCECVDRSPRGGLRPPLLVARVRPPTELRLLRCTNAHAQERGREPAVATGDALAKVLPQLFGRLSSVRWRTLLQSRSCNSRGTYAPALGRAGVRPPTELRLLRCTNAHAPGAAGVSPPSRMGNALAKALPQLLGRLPPVSWRTPLQSRCRNHGGLRLPLLCRSPVNGNRTVFRSAVS